MTQFNKVAVIGSGVMGSGIAAQIANAGVPVVLFDIVPKDASDRTVLAKSAIDRMVKAKDLEPLMHKKNAALITPANLEDDLALMEDCDWIVEVVLENLEVKHKTFTTISKHRKKGAIVSSNTSSIPLEKLVAPFDKDFKEHFLITHFFNPPRYLRLLELVVGKDTKADVIAKTRAFCDVALGKGVVDCHDTPGFIANRIGTYWLQTAVNKALSMDVSVEVADAVMSKPVGIPKTGVFGLLDLIGIDLMPHLSESLLSSLDKSDRYCKIYEDIPFIREMIAAGYTGRKGKGGFYRLDPEAKGERVKQSVALAAKGFDETSSYSKSVKPRLGSVSAGRKGLKAVLTSDDEGGQYAKAVLLETFAYTAGLVPEIADTIPQVDEAMRLGYNWKQGPFQMMDAVGLDWLVSELETLDIPCPEFIKIAAEKGGFYKIEGSDLFYLTPKGEYETYKRAEGVLLLEDVKRGNKPVFKTGSAALWDIGDGIICLEFTGKMNALDDQVFATIHKAISLIGDGQGEFKGLVVYNEASHFSAGANLGLALFAVNIALWPQIEALVGGGQEAYMALKYAPFPVVSAPSGMALGGGCEILLHSDHVQAHSETYCGLVEVGVGVIPGWGGCKEMLYRYQAQEKAATQKMWFSPDTTPMGAVRRAFETIGTAQVAKSAAQAKSLGYFKASDGVTMNRDRLLFDAKQKALELAKDYQVPAEPEPIRLPGSSGKMALNMAVGDLQKSGKATPYDGVVSDCLAEVLTGGEKADWTNPLTEKDILKLERAQFMILLKQKGTTDRIEHMLSTGKPLRN